MSNKTIMLGLLGLLLCLTGLAAQARCLNTVVLVHGNTGSPTDFQNTYTLLRQQGWSDAQIIAPAWGNAFCASCNDHAGSEETPVANAISSAIAGSCSGHIDVIGHSMGVTLAMHEIDRLNVASKVDVFIAIAGAVRGLWSCGTYPYNVANATCGAYGLSVHSPLLLGMATHRFGLRVYSMKSWTDEINCSTGTCIVDGAHTSTVPAESQSFDYPYGHFQLLWYTAADQVSLLR